MFAGSENPADCASRGINPFDLVEHKLWWQGPSWLAEDEKAWPLASDPVTPPGELPEQQRKAAGVVQRVDLDPEMLERYSTLKRLLRVTAWCRRWLRNRKQNEQDRALPHAAILAAHEVEAAQTVWIHQTQTKHYKAELAALQKREFIAKGSPLTLLNPFTDDQSILRVGGRLKHSLLSHDEKHPVILSVQSKLTQLIIDAYHRRTLHDGVQQTLGILRRQFWILQDRQAVKKHICQCVTCVRWRAATPQQIMANLPRSRVRPSRPFQHAGVDYAGPIMLRTTRGRGFKTYKTFIVVFVCMSTKAVHLDASDYSAEAFLAAYRRFVSRRGLCQAMYSDCGTTFVGADSQLRSFFSAGSKEGQSIANQLASDKVEWYFNPPSAPHFGGLWEAAVKSMKHHVRRVIGDTLTYEEMATLLVQVEACLNSRPLQALSDDHDDLDALTPGHLLIGTAINAVPEKSLIDSFISPSACWQHMQKMRDHF